MLHPNARMARLTFNQPAEKRYLFAEIGGIRLKIDAGQISFRPISSAKGTDVIPIASRSRGGRSADIAAEGTSAKALMKTFCRNGFTPDQPFFVLRDGPKGWVTMEHFPSDQPPPKAQPHLRIYPLMGDPAEAKKKETQEMAFDAKNWRMARRTVLKAVQIIQEYQAFRKPGSAPRIVQQAEGIMRSFTDLVGEVARATKMGTAKRSPKRPLSRKVA
jgi:hypothetical protein